MNFFKAQDAARRNTLYVLIMYVVCGLMLSYLLYCAVYIADHLYQGRFQVDNEWTPNDIVPPINIQLLGYVVLGFFGCIAVCSLVRWQQLSKGGEVIANSMGGRRISSHTKDPQERQLLNIVQEMALASGVPMPGVYHIPDQSINAFAAGTTINNAVIGVTTGSMNAFTREEMQAVIAHEFSHILNGDMRMNIRMIGITFGLSILGIIGALLLRSAFYSRLASRSSSNSKNNSNAPIIAAGIVLCIIGYIGVFFTNLMRMVISRQREYLADASAVQFTRNKSIAAALDRISKYAPVHDNAMDNASALEFSHLFFAEGVSRSLNSLFATHPPLASRIRRVMPEWDGKTDIATLKPQVIVPAANQANTTQTNNKMQMVSQLTNQIGSMAVAANAVNEFHQKMNPNVIASLQESYSARALIYTFLIDDDKTYRDQQLQYLQQHADAGVYDMIKKLLEVTSDIKQIDKLNLVRETMEPLRTLSKKQYERFLDNIAQLTIADNAISIFEWSLQALVVHVLNDNFNAKQRIPKAKDDDMAYALSILISCDDSVVPEQVFADTVQATALSLDYTTAPFNAQQLFNSMQRLSKISSTKKEKLVQAFTYAAMHNNKLEEKEEVLLRAYLALIDCPLPPSSSSLNTK